MSAEYERIYRQLEKIAGGSKEPEKALVDFTEALSRVTKMTDLEKADMRKEIERKKRPVTDHKYTQTKADPAHWTKEIDWEITNAAILTLDLEPRTGLGAQLWRYFNDDDFTERRVRDLLTSAEFALFEHARSIQTRAFSPSSKLDTTYHYGRKANLVEMKHFARWVMDVTPVPVPEWMKTLAGESERDRLVRELAEARADIDRLRGALPAVPRDEQGVTEVHGYPVGATWTADGGIIAAPSEQKPSESLVEEVRNMYRILAGNLNRRGRPSNSAREVAKKLGLDRNRSDYKAAFKQVDAEEKGK